MKLSLFFEKINTIDKQPDSSIKKKAQINKIRNEKKVTNDTTEIQMIIKNYYEQLYTNKMDNPKEMDNFLEIDYFQK